MKNLTKVADTIVQRRTAPSRLPLQKALLANLDHAVIARLAQKKEAPCKSQVLPSQCEPISKKL